MGYRKTKEVLAMANLLINTRPDASSAEVMRKAASMLRDIAEERAHLTQPAQAVDVEAIRCIAKLLRALSPDGEEWRSSNPNNATVLDVRKLADKLTAAISNANGKEG